MDMMWYRRRGLMVTPHIERITGAIASFNSDYNKIPVKSLICNIEPIQEGTGDPSPENVRPISGRTGLSVVRSGKNLFNPNSPDNLWVGSNNTFMHFSSAKSVTIPAQAEQVLTASMSNPRTASNLLILVFFDDDGNVLSRRLVASGRKVLTATAPANTASVLCSLYTYSEAGDVQLELGSATDYEPYKDNTYSVDWQIEAGTVYGGTMDVVSGKLVVDRAKRTFDGSEPWAAYPSFEGYLLWLGAMKQGLWQSGHSNMLKLSTSTDSGQKNTFWLGVNTKYIYVLGVYESMGSTVDNFKTYLSTHNLEIEYPLAEPTEIQLTPPELKTLLGENNIWCDSGDVSVDYWKWGN